MPLSLQMMDERKMGEAVGEKGKAIGQFARTFRWGDVKAGSITMRVRRERISGSKKFTYRTYFDRMPHSMRYTEVNNFSLYPVVRSYRKYLVLQDGDTAQALQDVKEFKQYNLELHTVDDIPSVAKVIAEAAADNMKSFAGTIDKRLLGNIDKDVALYSDQFYAANLLVVDVPKGRLEIPSLTRESLGFDMATAVIGPHKSSEAEIDGLKTYANAAKGMSTEAELFYHSVDALGTMLAANMVQMHKVSLNYTLFARDPQSLDKRVAEFIRRLPLGVRVEWIPMHQYELYKYGMPEPYHRKSFRVPTSHLGPLYPPMADLLEMSGIFLGTNWLTQSAVYIDSYLRDNGNEVIVGKPGGGKSVYIKVTEERYETLRPGETTLIIIDPSETSEYKALVDRINQIRNGKNVVEWRTLKDGLGIDVLRYGAATATNVLAKLFEISTANNQDLYSLLFNVVERAITIKKPIMELEAVATEVRSSAPAADKGLYSTLIHTIHRGLATYGRIFAGTMPEGSFAANIFSLNDLEVAAAISLIMLRSRELFGGLSEMAHKCLIIDEGYLALADREARVALDKISRQMRKKNLRLRFATQRPGDLAALAAKDGAVYETAVAIIEDSDMQVLFPHANIAYLKAMLTLSDYAINILKPSAHDAKAGRCVLIVGSGKTGRRISHTIVQIDATADQLKRYNTDPTKASFTKLIEDTAPALAPEVKKPVEQKTIVPQNPLRFRDS